MVESGCFILVQVIKTIETKHSQNFLYFQSGLKNKTNLKQNSKAPEHATIHLRLSDHCWIVTSTLCELLLNNIIDDVVFGNRLLFIFFFFIVSDNTWIWWEIYNTNIWLSQLWGILQCCLPSHQTITYH